MVTVLGFFNNISRGNIRAENIKAIHFLGKPGESAIIVKFLYFALKNFIWRQKKILKEYKNPKNNKPYFLECLPSLCRELFKAAKDEGVQVVTYNSEVQIVCPRKDGKVNFRPVHTK